MIRRLLAAAALIGLTATAAMADPLAKTVFGSFRSANSGPSAAIGSYSRGCASGNVQLPESGPTWQAMRLSRNRNWGQPELVQFLVGLSQAATQIGWRGIYVGDMSQPRGGPMVSGHASHQIGLDADIWMLPPSSLRLSAGQRESISSVSVVAPGGLGLSGHWTAGHAALIRAAASDPRVVRIFLDAAIKVELCRMNGNRGQWLQKLRPTPNHDYHFHVRLKCNSRACSNPARPVSELSGRDNGCGEAMQELRYRANPRSRPRGTPDPEYRHPRSFRLSELPRQCTNVAAAR